MKRMTITLVLAMATCAAASITSQVTFTLTPDGGGIPLWNFTVGTATEATDGFDSGLDSLEPPWSPGPEVRMHTQGVTGALGAMNQDYREGGDYIDVNAYWTPAGSPWRLESWGLGALDGAYTDLCTIDGANLGLTGYTTGTITWDLSAAGALAYHLYCYEDDVEIELLPGGSYDWSVMNRFGMGPTLVVSCSDLTPFPEPGTLALLATGLAGALALARRKTR